MYIILFDMHVLLLGLTNEVNTVFWFKMYHSIIIIYAFEHVGIVIR